MNNRRDRLPIIVRATPEMANWMHPQTDERKKLIQKRVAAAKERFSQRKKHAVKSANPFSPRVEIQVGSIPVAVMKMKSHRVLKSVPSCK
ncbi:hypothetical protein [Brevibacillus sp. H7]|uniref:hypothetical protein n=1 Tax=Brevibacillus sp. H7 TaxID=3349138 RepID=UPI00382E4E1A